MASQGEAFSRKKSCCRSFCGWLCCGCCRREELNVERKVWLDGRSEPVNSISNAVNNQKYNFINFIPLVLFNQFKLFFNFFQLAINLSQLVPILKVGKSPLMQGSSSLISLLSSWSWLLLSLKKLMMILRDIEEIKNAILLSTGFYAMVSWGRSNLKISKSETFYRSTLKKECPQILSSSLHLNPLALYSSKLINLMDRQIGKSEEQ